MATPAAEEPLVKKEPSQDDSFYETIDRSPEFDNNLNSKSPVMTEEEKAQQREEWQRELLKLEEEIHTLQTVLSAKVRCAGELKRKLGITPYVEFKQDMQHGLKSFKESDAYQKTNETLTNINESIQKTPAYQKTSDAFKSFGAFASKKLGDARNSVAFKSFEEKVGGAYSSVKTKVTGSRSENSFQELQETEGATGSASGTPSPATTPGTTEVSPNTDNK